MRRTLALIRASWRTAASYRLRLLISIGSLLATVVPLYFVTHALQPVMQETIQTEGGQYFGFVIVGMMTFLMLPAAVGTLSSEVAGGINTGTFEALLGTPARLYEVLLGLSGFNLLWTAVRGLVTLAAAWFLGANILWSHLPLGLLILGMIVLAYLPIGIIFASLVIAFRTPGPLPQAVLTLSALLGGVYYPTKVIPSWIQYGAVITPLSYGLRALRGVLLQGESLGAVSGDLAILAAFVLGLSAVAALALHSALRYARREGTLSQY